MEQWIVILLFIISIAASSSKAKKAAAEAKNAQKESEFEAALEDILKKAAKGDANIEVKQVTPAPTYTTAPPVKEDAYKPMQIAPEGRNYDKKSVTTTKPKRNVPPRPKKATPKSEPVPTQDTSNEEILPEGIDARNLIIYEAILNPKHTEY